MIYRIINLHYTYPDGTNALKGINLTINKRRTVILGHNGSGKTTLLFCMIGLYKPQTGYIEFEGNRLKYDKKSLLSLRKKVSIVFQNPDDQIVMPTVYQEISFGLINMNIKNFEDNVKDIMKKFKLDGNRLTHNLSFGEKKKVCLASALALKPKVLLLDEPLSGLDYPSRLEFLDILHELKDTYLIVTTHDIEFAYEFAEEVVLLMDGKVVLVGDPDEIFNERILKYGYDIPKTLKLKQFFNVKIESRNFDEILRRLKK